MKLKNVYMFLFSVYDSSSKFPTGILAGKSFDFGNFDECLKTATTGLDFEPQYCIINVRFSPTSKLYPNYNNITPSNLNPTDSVWEATKVIIYLYIILFATFGVFIYAITVF